jgi:signal transduction histidine kinase
MTDAFSEVRRLLDELHQAAKTGAIIPVRLPAQIEAIREALNKATSEVSGNASAATEASAEGSGDDAVRAALREQALFFGHAIHELRTPMTSIRGYSDMMIGMGGLTDMQKQFMDTVRTNTRRLESLMQDVSDINKIRAGTLKLSPKMELFRNIAQQTEKAMQPTAEQLKRTLVIDVPQGLPLLNLDGDILTRALNKLVENGLRYHEGEGGTCTLRASADGNTVVVTISDDGTGITPEDFQRLGEVYFRSESEMVRSYKGSGLGVAVAQGLVAALGGTVTFESEPGKGTTATIRLPGMTA